MKSESASYKAAGVDITAGYKAVELMKRHVARTMTAGVLDGIGGFGGMFELNLRGHQEAGAGQRHRRRGYQAENRLAAGQVTTPWASTVWPCASTTLSAAGAKPLVFLDYIACGKNIPEKIAQIVAGVAEGCVQAGVRPDRR